MARRRGDKNAFWDAASVGIGGVSNAVDVGTDVEQVAIFVSVNGATTVTMEVAHQGDLTSEGVISDDSGGALVWFPLYYLDTAVTFVFAGAGSIAKIIPDFAPGWIRLKSSAAATITAGWQSGSAD